MIKIRLDTKSEQSILNMLLDNQAINASQLSKINSTSSEVGKTKIETAIELNLTNEEKISNYGWPIASYGVPYRSQWGINFVFEESIEIPRYEKSHKKLWFFYENKINSKKYSNCDG